MEQVQEKHTTWKEDVDRDLGALTMWRKELPATPQELLHPKVGPEDPIMVRIDYLNTYSNRHEQALSKLEESVQNQF